MAAGDLVFVVTDGAVQALDGATGEPVRSYPEAGRPTDLLHSAGLLVAVDGAAVRAVEVDSGKRRWEHQASEPRYVVAGDQNVFLLEGSPRRGEKAAAVCLDLATGSVRWQRDDYPWLDRVRWIVCGKALVAFEVSTLNNDKEGNAVYVASAGDGEVLWDRTFVPSMNHMKQARAMFIGDKLWVLEDRKCVALDPATGAEEQSCPAGLCHCFPPVATPNYMFSGEMELTGLTSGLLDANRITKAACSRDFGWVPAGGLIHVTPKHCVCWPMLRGYAALAPERADGPPIGEIVEKAVADRRFVLETGVSPPDVPADDSAADWPCYRGDAWRSGSTATAVPLEIAPKWTAELGGRPGEGPIAQDWQENPFVRGPVTPPVIAGGTVVVARPDAHEVVALDADTGQVRWRRTVDGRVDTAPTIHRGLCLFGTKTGWVYSLRADDGRVVWRLRAAPTAENIVAYGQVESPWPVPGSVLVVDGVAYFAAGRQPLADGGILVFAVEPATGAIRWVRRLDSVPTQNFYGSSGMEFDNFDLLHREADAVAMSRWLFTRSDGEMTCKAREAFARHQEGGLNVVVPRRCWTYAPRNQPRADRNRPQERPLVVFRGNTVLGCRHDQRTVYRRDFTPEAVAKFDTTWLTGWAAGQNFQKKQGDAWPSDRVAKETTWSVPVFGDDAPDGRIAGMVWAGQTLWLAGFDGGLVAVSPGDGKVLARRELPGPIWDGMAAAGGRLFVSTRQGAVVCLAGR